MFVVDAYETLKRAFRSAQAVTTNVDTGKRRRTDNTSSGGAIAASSTGPTVIALDPAGLGHIVAGRAPDTSMPPVSELSRSTTFGNNPSLCTAVGASAQSIPVFNAQPAQQMSELSRSTTFGYNSATGIGVHASASSAFGGFSAVTAAGSAATVD